MKKSNHLTKPADEIWEIGQKHKLSYDDWAILIWRLQLTLMKNFIEPTYNMYYATTKKKK